MSDPQNPLPPPTAPELIGRILRWLIIAAAILAFVLILLPVSMAFLPFGLILILIVALLFFAFGKMPPSWLACIDPKDVGKLGAAAWPLLIALLVGLVAMVLGPIGLLVGAMIAVVLFALGWAGIGPLAPFALLLRGLIQLIQLLPDLRGPIKLAADAMDNASKAVESLRKGLDEAQQQVGNVSATIAAIDIPKISTSVSTQNVNLPTPPGGSIPVPVLSVTATPDTPFSGNVARRLSDVQAKLADASAAAQTQRDQLKAAAAALKALHDLLPSGRGEPSP